VPDTSRLPAVYFLYVLGSGGHTTEMLEIIKRHFKPQSNQHRRYLVGIGDQDSLDRVIKLEATIRRAYDRESAGTIDAFHVPRARRVHQPLWTAPLTCLLTAVHAVNALTREPDARPRTRHGAQFKYPHVVVTNGPATGFIVCAVAHLLKLFCLVPPGRLKMVYVESWARTRSLSLTGRLFRWSGIADVFCVQHERLARAVPGALYVGPIAAPLPPPG
ncbi:glycosyltransferase family 1 protein, partial [Thermothielavioides terrestris NRRL 8126]